jgi:hypothetical protein
MPAQSIAAAKGAPWKTPKLVTTPRPEQMCERTTRRRERSSCPTPPLLQRRCRWRGPSQDYYVWLSTSGTSTAVCSLPGGPLSTQGLGCEPRQNGGGGRGA